MFPTTSNAEFKALPPADAAAMGQYAGQAMTTGAQAKVYADNFIAFHLSKMGGTYSQLSAASLAQPANLKLAGAARPSFSNDQPGARSHQQNRQPSSVSGPRARAGRSGGSPCARCCRGPARPGRLVPGSP